jgi:hypothetical protein
MARPFDVYRVVQAYFCSVLSNCRVLTGKRRGDYLPARARFVRKAALPPEIPISFVFILAPTGCRAKIEQRQACTLETAMSITGVKERNTVVDLKIVDPEIPGLASE